MLHARALHGKLPGPASGLEQTSYVSIGPVRLLGVLATARVLLNQAEHERRNAYELGPVTDPALLESLLELQPGEPVTNLVFWAETSSLPGGIVGRGDDGYTVTRLLETPLAVRDVILHARKGRELLAVQDASLFVGFTARWVSVGHEDIPDAVVMEAKLCGVGLMGPGSDVLLEAEQPEVLARDGWSWLLEEKAYGRWLKEQTLARETGNLVRATGEASATSAGLLRARSGRRRPRPQICNAPTKHPWVRMRKGRCERRVPGWPCCAGKPPIWLRPDRFPLGA